jgi:pyridinium-3,5-bisthiocarboxylic acid mononucleotide nickel chelatase
MAMGFGNVLVQLQSQPLKVAQRKLLSSSLPTGRKPDWILLMTRTLYLDVFSGISGDMFVGALLDLGVESQHLESELKKLDVEGYHLHVTRKTKAGIAGVKFDVHLAQAHEHGHEHSAQDHAHAHHGEHSSHEHEHGHEHGHASHGHEPVHDHVHVGEHGHVHAELHPHEPAFDEQAHAHPAQEHAGHHHEGSRDFAEIQRLILASTLSDWVKEKAVAVFHRIAVAEGKIHGHPPEQVHFHEVGAVDSIVDIVAGCVALESLGRPRVLASPVVEGSGWIRCAHGRFPIPAPATLEILGARRIPLTQCAEPYELVTPTGAALLAEFVEQFGPMQNLAAMRIGYGLGTRDNKTRPNVLRAILSDSSNQAAHDWESDTITIIETNLDDVSPEILGYFTEHAFANGALDVFHMPAQMKKNRPGILLTVLCANADADKFAELILRETGSFGVRRYFAERRKLRRSSKTVRTEFGDVQVKLGMLDGQVLHVTPEFESARRVANECGVSLKQVYDSVQKVPQ